MNLELPGSDEHKQRDEWQTRMRQSTDYDRAVSLLNEIKLAKRNLAELEKNPLLNTDAGQLARIDLMERQIERIGR